MRLKTLAILGITLTLAGCGDSREAMFDAPLFPDDAFSLAAAILTQAGTRGCGEFEVERQVGIFKQIDVVCIDGSATKKHKLQYWPEFTVDGRPAAKDPWQATWLSEVYCVLDEGARWEMAFLKATDAIQYALKRSERVGEPSFIYSSNSLIYWQTKQNDQGVWAHTTPPQEVRNRDERFGCELEKSPL